MQTHASALPPLVQKANALAEKLGFPLMPDGRPPGHEGPPSACIPQVGRLLGVLVAAKPGGRFAEHGTGSGVGTAWMVSAMAAESRLISVEVDTERAAAVRELFRDVPNLDLRPGDWHAALKDEPPFDLVFMDAGIAEDIARGDWDSLVESVKVGGQIVMDDIVPVELYTPEMQDIVDHKREFAFKDPRLFAVELYTTPITAALIMTRIK